jgi:oxygen-dependent protoporphyrinogen oxidase
VQGANTLHLLEEVGLAEKIVPVARTHPAARNRLILANGRLHKLPSALRDVLRRSDPFSRPLVMAAWHDLVSPAKRCEDDSVYDFALRRFGPDVANYIVDPMTRGICAGDAREISAAAFVLAPLFRMEQDDGGVVRSIMKRSFRKANTGTETSKDCDLVRRSKAEGWSVWSLSGGLQTLPETLAEHLVKGGTRVDTNAAARGIEVDAGRGLRVLTEVGEIACDHVFSCLPAANSAALLRPLSQEAAEDIDAIPYVTLAVATIEFTDSSVSEEAKDAFGFLVPSTEPGERILGAVFDTCAFPQKDRSIFTVMLGGRWFDRHFGADVSREELERVAVTDLKRVLGIEQDPRRVSLRVHKQSIPQYVVGHAQRVRRAREALAQARLPISLVGSAYDGVGINDATLSAYRAVEQLIG